MEAVKLNIRVGAILEYKGKILVEKNKNVDFGVIIGGRIRTLENRIENLIREIKEEINIDLSNEKFELISLIENFFEFAEKKHHELFFVYKTTLSDDYGIKADFANVDNDNSKFYWYTKEDFKKEKNIAGNFKGNNKK